MGKTFLIQMDYYETYWFANLLHNIIQDPNYIRNLEDFFGDLGYRNFLSPFPKLSALHLFIEFILKAVIHEELDDLAEDSLVNDPDFRLWAEKAMAHHSIPHTRFHDWRATQGIARKDITQDALFDYYFFLENEDHDAPLYTLLDKVTEEIFFLTFMNREFLRQLNEIIAGYIRILTMDELQTEEKKSFRKNGVLKRTNIPMWVKKAVYHRDRGHCVFCNRDLTGLVSIFNNKHFDHIVPLSEGGINDITNIQLLCETCNTGKGNRSTKSSKQYERWY